MNSLRGNSSMKSYFEHGVKEFHCQNKNKKKNIWLADNVS